MVVSGCVLLIDSLSLDRWLYARFIHLVRLAKSIGRIQQSYIAI